LKPPSTVDPASTFDGDFKSPLLEVFRRFHALNGVSAL